MPELNSLDCLKLLLQIKSSTTANGKLSYPGKTSQVFLTGWEEEMHNDRMGIYMPNPITDFVMEPERKRQKLEY